ncbi:MAG: type VI secretion system tip protein VgrG, partial [Planctomycetes bacterium]|nr:type VI secretion system tip protein VgrG [Planctomycetota bacterium]
MTIKNQEITVRSTALPSHPLVVQKLRGEERMSGLFRFELDLICDDPELDLEEVLYAPVTLGIKVGIKLGSGQVGTSTREICGVFAEFEQHEEGQGWTKYRAVMVPKLWTTTCAYRSRVFQEKTIEELVTDVLTANALDPEHDFEFQLQREGADGDAKTRAVYPQREYVVQYEETDWHFLARWLEHEGVYFYFTNEDGEEKVVFADTDSSYDTSPFGSTFPYRPEAAGDGGDGDKFVEEEVRTFRCRQQRLPKQVHVTDYNWRIPSRLHYQADVREGGTGLMAEYNDHFKDEAQGKALAKLRAEELTCRARVYQGTSSCRSFRPGATFELTEHFRDAWNRSYLLTSVRHDAEQMISLESATVTGTKYENSFEAITDDQTWRPERTTDWPSIKGVMHASIDAEGDGHYAELDEHGRYKLTMPYDEALDAEDRKDGKASRWVRMAQPFAGKGAGMHFPLHKGTEVLVTHIDGDPDRPIITGAVPNPMTESPSNNEDPTSNAIRTTSGNLLKMDDHDEHPGFVMMDAMRSEVSDSRRRRKPSTDRQQANASGGQGNAERPQAAALPGGGRGSGSGGNHDDTQDARIDQNEGDIDDLEGEVAGIGTDINNLQKEIQDLKNPTTLSFTKSWKEFFKETVTVNGTTEDTAYKLTRDRGTLTSEQEDANSDKGVGLTEVDRDKIAYVDNSGSALSEGDDVPMNEAN